MKSFRQRQTGRVLLVNEPGAQSRHLQERLRSLGYDVVAVEDGPQGLAYVLGHDVDVVLLDRELPTLDGLQACRIIKKYPQTTGIGLVVMGTPDPDSRVEALRAGADDFLPHGISLEELDAKIQVLLRVHRLRQHVEVERRQLETILESLSDAVLIVADDGMIQRANRAAYQLLHLDPDIIQVRSFGEIFSMLGVDQSLVDRILGCAVPVHDELSVDLEDGNHVLALRTQRVRELDRTLPLTAIVLQDVTGARAHERLKADFHSMIAHDLRNPITVVGGYVQLLRDGKAGPVSPIQEEFLEAIQSKMDDMTRLLDDFLDVSKLDAGFIVLNVEPVRLADLVSEALGDVSFHARDRNIDMEAEIAPEATELRLTGDPKRLQQVLQNLLTNAVKYNRDGGGIRVRAFPIDDAVCVEVEDDGIGIPEEEQKAIFERYHRAKNGRENVKGVGLGLMIVRKIVEAHGGELGVRSRDNEGSTFWFTLECPGARPLSADRPSDEVVEV